MTWRELDDDPGPRPASASLDAITRKLGVTKAASLEALFTRWSDIVGEGVATHAKPVSLRDGGLIVAVDDPAWATELRSLTAQILERCVELAGPDLVRRIDIRVRR